MIKLEIKFIHFSVTYSTFLSQDYCLPPVGSPSEEVAAQFVLEAAEITSVAALETEMSFCCPQQFTDCMAAGGVCMPSFVKSLCPLAVDSYCPADSCTCCIFQPRKFLLAVSRLMWTKTGRANAAFYIDFQLRGSLLGLS